MHNVESLSEAAEVLKNYWDYYEWQKMHCQLSVDFEELYGQEHLNSAIKTFVNKRTFENEFILFAVEELKNLLSFFPNEYYGDMVNVAVGFKVWEDDECDDTWLEIFKDEAALAEWIKKL